jgi:hypothetical protein
MKCIGDLRPVGMSRCVGWYLDTDGPEQPFFSIFKTQAVQEEFNLFNVTASTTDYYIPSKEEGSEEVK